MRLTDRPIARYHHRLIWLIAGAAAAVLCAAAVAVAWPGSALEVTLAISASDAGGDCCGADGAFPPAVDLTSADLQVDDDKVVLTWRVNGDIAQTDPDRVYWWQAVLKDRSMTRVVTVARAGERWTAKLDYASRDGSGRAALRSPHIGAQWIRLTTSLEELRWPGERGLWHARTQAGASTGDMVVVDTQDEQRIGAEGSAPAHESGALTTVNINDLDRWSGSRLLYPARLPPGWTLVAADVIRRGTQEWDPLDNCDRVAMTFGAAPHGVIDVFQADPACATQLAALETPESELPRRLHRTGTLTGWVATTIPYGVGLLVAQLSDAHSLLAVISQTGDVADLDLLLADFVPWTESDFRRQATSGNSP